MMGNKTKRFQKSSSSILNCSSVATALRKMYGMREKYGKLFEASFHNSSTEYLGIIIYIEYYEILHTLWRFFMFFIISWLAVFISFFHSRTYLPLSLNSSHVAGIKLAQYVLSRLCACKNESLNLSH